MKIEFQCPDRKRIINQKRERKIIKSLIYNKNIWNISGEIKSLTSLFIVVTSVVESYLLFNKYDIWWGQLFLILNGLLIVYLFDAYEKMYEKEKQEQEEIQEIKNAFSQTIIKDTLQEYKEKH